jgi:DNA invertase Pin-like site-specific DNA recombinase
MAKAAMWLRVSTDHQDTDNQVESIEQFSDHHGHTITRTYRLAESAWNGGKDGGEYRAAIKQALDDAYRGEFSVLIVWALDRLTRGGAEEMLKLIRHFRERGCIIVSIQETWLSGSPEIQDVLVAFAGWIAQQDSARRSARIKAGLARRKAAGKSVGGRKPGATDKKKRATAGYAARYQRERGPS